MIDFSGYLYGCLVHEPVRVTYYLGKLVLWKTYIKANIFSLFHGININKDFVLFTFWLLFLSFTIFHKILTILVNKYYIMYQAVMLHRVWFQMTFGVLATTSILNRSSSGILLCHRSCFLIKSLSIIFVFFTLHIKWRTSNK